LEVSKISESGSQSMRRLEKRLRLAVYIIAVVVTITGALGILRIFQVRNAPPRNYFAYQLGIWRTMAAKNPKNPAFQQNIGSIYQRMGEDSRAFNYYKRALAINPKFVPSLYSVGLYYKKKGNIKEAISYLNQAGTLGAKGNKALAYFTLGDIYKDKKQIKRALKYYKLSLKDARDNWNTFYRLGQVYEQLGKKDMALKNYRTAAKFNPENVGLEKKIKELSR